MLEDHTRHILAVEDNPDTLTLLRYMLRSRCHLVATTKVEEALRLADQQPYELFLLDINLGDERSGIDLLHLLRAVPQNKSTPALALTAYAMPGDRERFLQAGFNGYVSKPFTRKELMTAINEVLLNKALP